MDANSGKRWSKMDILDLKNEIGRGRTVAQIASFLCRDEDEVREKMRELVQRRTLSASPPITLIPSKRLGGPPPSAALKPLRKALTGMAVENICALPSVDYSASGAGVLTPVSDYAEGSQRCVRPFHSLA